MHLEDETHFVLARIKHTIHLGDETYYHPSGETHMHLEDERFVI